MVRALEFDPDVVLVKAMNTFWEKGVEHTSISDLVSATGVQRSGLYNVFGNKEALFKEAIQLYFNNLMANMFKGLQQDDADLSAIEALFDRFNEMIIGDNASKGCFMCNSASSFSKEASFAMTIVEEFFSTIEACFYRALKRSRKAGEFTDTLSDSQLAQYFVGCIISLSNLCRTQVGRNIVQSYLQQIQQKLASLRG